MKNKRPELLKASKSSEKTCPLLNQPCLGQKCGLWINIQKPIIIETGDGQDRFPDPYHKLTYEGCGLIHHIPWERTPIKPSKPSRKETSENE